MANEGVEDDLGDLRRGPRLVLKRPAPAKRRRPAGGRLCAQHLVWQTPVHFSRAGNGQLPVEVSKHERPAIGAKVSTLIVDQHAHLAKLRSEDGVVTTRCAFERRPEVAGVLNALGDTFTDLDEVPIDLVDGLPAGRYPIGLRVERLGPGETS